MGKFGISAHSELSPYFITFWCSFSDDYTHSRLRCKQERNTAIKASNVNFSCCPHTHSTTGADVFSGARWLAACDSHKRSCVRSIHTSSNACDIVAAETNFCEIVFYTEFQESIRRGSNRPTIGRMMFYQQITGFSSSLKIFVVVSVFSAAILYFVSVVPVVAHFMEESNKYIL